jgi:hypothetical protein
VLESLAGHVVVIDERLPSPGDLPVRLVAQANGKNASSEALRDERDDQVKQVSTLGLDDTRRPAMLRHEVRLEPVDLRVRVLSPAHGG